MENEKSKEKLNPVTDDVGPITASKHVDQFVSEQNLILLSTLYYMYGAEWTEPPNWDKVANTIQGQKLTAFGENATAESCKALYNMLMRKDSRIEESEVQAQRMHCPLKCFTDSQKRCWIIAKTSNDIFRTKRTQENCIQSIGEGLTELENDAYFLKINNGESDGGMEIEQDKVSLPEESDVVPEEIIQLQDTGSVRDLFKLTSYCANAVQYAISQASLYVEERRTYFSSTPQVIENILDADTDKEDAKCVAKNLLGKEMLNLSDEQEEVNSNGAFSRGYPELSVKPKDTSLTEVSQVIESSEIHLKSPGVSSPQGRNSTDEMGKTELKRKSPSPILDSLAFEVISALENEMLLGQTIADNSDQMRRQSQTVQEDNAAMGETSADKLTIEVMKLLDETQLRAIISQPIEPQIYTSTQSLELCHSANETFPETEELANEKEPLISLVNPSISNCHLDDFSTQKVEMPKCIQESVDLKTDADFSQLANLEKLNPEQEKEQSSSSSSVSNLGDQSTDTFNLESKFIEEDDITQTAKDGKDYFITSAVTVDEETDKTDQSKRLTVCSFIPDATGSQHAKEQQLDEGVPTDTTTENATPASGKTKKTRKRKAGSQLRFLNEEKLRLFGDADIEIKLSYGERLTRGRAKSYTSPKPENSLVLSTKSEALSEIQQDPAKGGSGDGVNSDKLLGPGLIKRRRITKQIPDVLSDSSCSPSNADAPIKVDQIFQAKALSVLNKIQNHKSYQAIQECLKDQVAIIRLPLKFQDIQRKIETGVMRSFAVVQKDLYLLITNVIFVLYGTPVIGDTVYEFQQHIQKCLEEESSPSSSKTEGDSDLSVSEKMESPAEQGAKSVSNQHDGVRGRRKRSKALLETETCPDLIINSLPPKRTRRNVVLAAAD